ncbi:MAG: hypothetical protein F4X89_08860 [Dehalococcoidia bacterium]|nr:hypothetical protein [Dehalococcoidia bacterium]
MRKTSVIAAFMFTLAACGGGGGGGENEPPSQPEMSPEQESPEQETPPERETARLPFPFRAEAVAFGTPHYDTESLPAVAGADARHMPIYTDATASNEAGPSPFSVSRPRIFVGVDQGNIGALPVTGSRENLEIRFGQVADGAGRNQLADFIFDSSSGPTRRWRQAPIVHVLGSASPREQSLVAETVRLVNTALPDEFKMTLGSPLPENAEYVPGRITVVFESQSPDFSTAGEAYSNFENLDGTPNIFSGDVVNGSRISVYKNTNVYADVTGNTDLGIASNRRAAILLAHEFMHALGFYNRCHPSCSYDGHVAATYPTISEGTAHIYQTAQNGVEQPLSILYPIDREALRALYSIAPGTDVRGVYSDEPAFGDWASTSMHVHGNGPHAGFGVALRNGYAEPWAYGYEPRTDLADNRSLVGRATWSGTLLGMTPSAEAVAGDASIGINMATLSGRADFTGLEKWAANRAPGATGTGTMWGDGDLGYSITARGNTFRETGGDAGRLTGVFTGARHEGAAGTLERSDLTAAFGASR